MIAAVRIAGQVKRSEREKETLNRLKLRKKFSCILVEEDDKIRLGMLESVKHLIAYGKVPEEFVKKLKEKRDKGKGVFFLHPPRGGFKKSSKQLYPKGILGKHDDITKLLERML